EGSTYFLLSEDGKEAQTNFLNSSILSTYNQPQSAFDPCLKSNTGFCIATSVAPQLMMNPAVEETVETIGKLISNEIRPPQPPDTIQLEVAVRRENEQTANVLRQMIETSTIHANENHHYEEADKLWIIEQPAWEERTAAQRDLEFKATMHRHTQELLENVTEARNKVDTKKTFLGRIAKYSLAVAKPLSVIPSPIPLAGLACGIFATAEIANQIWVNKDVVLAKRVVKNASQEVEKATQEADTANKKSIDLRKQAQDFEQRARLHESASRKNDLERLKPPVTSLDEEEWKKWAARIVKEGKGNPDLIESLANYGMTHSSWVEREIAAAWKKRISYSDEMVKKQESKKAFLLEPLEAAFKKATNAAQTANKKVIVAQERLTMATKLQYETKRRLEEMNEELNQLEKAPSRPEIVSAIEEKKRKFCTTFDDLQQSFKNIKAFEEELVNAHIVLDQEEKKAFKASKDKDAIEKPLIRDSERLKAHVEADRAAWRDVFPENNYHYEEELKKDETEHLVTTPAVSSALSHGDDKAIEPPLIYDTVMEKIGRALLREARKAKSQSSEPAQEITTIDIQNEGTHSSREEILKSPRADEDFEASKDVEITIPEITNPTKEDHARWMAWKEANELADKADKASESLQRRASMSKESISAPRNSFFGRITGSSNRASNAANDSSSALFKNVQKATKEALIAKEKWIVLARQAEGRRITSGGTSFVNDEAAMEAWTQADQRDIEAEAERSRIKEEEEIHARMAKTWDANTVRWAARAEADRLAANVKEAEDELARVMEHFRTTSSAAFDSVSNKVEQARAAADETKRHWSLLADQDESVSMIRVTQSHDEKALAVAKDKLKQADRAVNVLLEVVEKRYNAEEGEDAIREATFSKYEDENNRESPAAQTSKITQEIGTYKVDLLLKKETDMTTCFSKVNMAKLNAQEKYHSSYEGNNKTKAKSKSEAKALYDEVSKLEEMALKNYAKMTELHALKAAREKIPGAAEVWAIRVDKAKDAAIEAQKVVEKRGGTSKIARDEVWADDSLRAVERAAA
ncbi:MAG TPA: hypothetical protein VJK54_11115, partial [Chthoniobacterales bacterium]|nr:hypothetical protein [Chthoniobacterales bacterium]